MSLTPADPPTALSLGQLFDGELAAAAMAIQRKDAEALHDFRVALRRLDVLVTQLAPPAKQRKRIVRIIKGLITQSDEDRDLQVMLAWLNAEWPHLNEPERIGARRWQRKLERLQRHRRLIPKQATALLKGLELSLARLAQHDAPRRVPLALHIANQLQQQTDRLMALLGGEGAPERLHLIRLQAKRVRYLLLPMCEASAACSRAEAALHQMQQVLGDWHDTVLCQLSLTESLRQEIQRALSRSHPAGIPPPQLAGLITLARTNLLAQQHLVERISQDYLSDGAASLSGILQQAVAELRLAATAQS